jgi:hypothetical protein
MVSVGSQFYISLAANNLNNAPASSASMWEPVSPSTGIQGPAGPAGAAGPPGPIGVSGAQGPAGPPANFTGTWSNTTSYSLGQAVSYAPNGDSYISLIGSNIGHEPDTSPADWGLIASAAASTPQSIASSLIDSSGTSMYESSRNPTSPGIQNVVMGVAAGSHLTAGVAPSLGGQHSVIIGYKACQVCTTAREDVVIGAEAGESLTGASGTGGGGASAEDSIVTLVGSFAGQALMAGVGSGASLDEVMVGQKAGESITSGGGDTIVGTHAGTGLNTSSGNTLLGRGVMDSSGPTWSAHNTIGIGFAVMAPLSTGASVTDDIAIGTSAMGQGEAGNNTSYDIAIGTQAGSNFGPNAQYNVCAGYFTCGVGGGPPAAPFTGTHNLFLGNFSADQLTTGNSNTAVGEYSAYQLTTGSGNVGVGYGAGTSLATGSNNVNLGFYAGQHAAPNISDVVLIGAGAGISATSSGMTAVGFSAGNNATGANDTFLGQNAGTSVTSGSYDTCVGDSSCAGLGGAETYDTGIGYNADFSSGVVGSAEIGAGTNTVSNTLAFAGYTVADHNGNLYDPAIGSSAMPLCTTAAGKLTNTGCAPVYRGVITLTAATSDSVTVAGLPTTASCTFSPSNSTATTPTILPWYSIAANTFTLNHAATVGAGASFGYICSTF